MKQNKTSKTIINQLVRILIVYLNVYYPKDAEHNYLKSKFNFMVHISLRSSNKHLNFANMKIFFNFWI